MRAVTLSGVTALKILRGTEIERASDELSSLGLLCTSGMGGPRHVQLWQKDIIEKASSSFQDHHQFSALLRNNLRRVGAAEDDNIRRSSRSTYSLVAKRKIRPLYALGSLFHSGPRRMGSVE